MTKTMLLALGLALATPTVAQETPKAITEAPDEILQKELAAIDRKYQPQFEKILDDVMTTYAPIAARVTECGAWSAEYWLVKVMDAAIVIYDRDEKAVLAVAKRFTALFNEAANTRSELARWPCDVVNDMALDGLVQLEKMRTN
jgi:hypothetical protein